MKKFMRLFKRASGFVVESEIDNVNYIIRRKEHVFALHHDAVFIIEEVENGVNIAGRLYTKAEAVKQLEAVSDGLRYVVSKLK